MSGMAKLLLLGGPVGIVFSIVLVSIIMLVMFLLFGIWVMIGIFLLIVGLFIEISTAGQGKEGHIMVFLGILFTAIGFII